LKAAGAGFVVAPGDVSGLERAIRVLAADRDESRRLGLQGYQWFRTNRSREVAIRAWDRLLREEEVSPMNRQTALDSPTPAL
jgi:glycosyltransferase involved in cell wall biosynthesis